MGLKDALETERSKSTASRCSVCMALPQLPKDDAAALESAMGNPEYTGSAIARALASEGFDVGDQAVNRHRRNACRGTRS